MTETPSPRCSPEILERRVRMVFGPESYPVGIAFE